MTAPERAPIIAELRKVAAELRTRPIPLADVIPLLQRAADALEKQ